MLLTRHPAPALDLPLVGGGRFTLGAEAPAAFTILVFYRGKHCPICKGYLASVQAALDEAEAMGCRIVVASMDTAERAEASVAEWEIGRLSVGYGMDEATARAWGLYLSSARPGTQEPAVFSEPGLAVIDPAGTVYFAQMQSAPFTRPPIADLLKGLKFVLANDYPARGDLTQAA